MSTATVTQGTKRLVKVRVYFKHPLGNKSATHWMTENLIAWNQENKRSSPYTKVVRI